ncbi:MAG: cytochrome c [bacterium]|nr:cytochrome c [bacterium]
MGGCLSAAIVAGCSDKVDPVVSTAEQVSEEEFVMGKMVYLTRCVGCHGVDGVGIVGPDIRPGRVLEKYASAEAMATVVRDGLGEMPEFGSKLRDEEIAAVVAYVRGGLG